MEELPHLIIDLAYILIVAGGVTIIFKKLRQPLVLGYIVAGFLAGPHMPYTPSIMDSTSISDWSQIGVIFLMFTLGLEFSFKRIIKMGWQPIIAALYDKRGQRGRLVVWVERYGPPVPGWYVGHELHYHYL